MLIDTPPLVERPDNHQKYRFIIDYDLSPVSRWLSKRKPDLDVSKAEKQFKKYVYLLLVTGQKLTVPSDDVDEYLHAAILHSELYHQFCNDIFGRYLHHQPEEGRSQEDVKQGHDELAELSRTHFGGVFFEFNLADFDCRCEQGNC